MAYSSIDGDRFQVVLVARRIDRMVRKLPSLLLDVVQIEAGLVHVYDWFVVGHQRQ